MNWELHPLNENQGMNARVKFTGTVHQAKLQALTIAVQIQAALPNCSISCSVANAADEDPLWIAYADGKVISAITGNEVKL